MYAVTECCSESRMRSRTSRGVPEWSGGEELYIGSPVLATGKVSGVIGIVPGPPEGSRGSTGWGHLSRRAPWAGVGGKPALSGMVFPLPLAHEAPPPTLAGAPEIPFGHAGYHPVPSEHFRTPKPFVQYINLHLRTIPGLLVTSGISSGTPNNIR